MGDYDFIKLLIEVGERNIGFKSIIQSSFDIYELWSSACDRMQDEELIKIFVQLLDSINTKGAFGYFFIERFLERICEEDIPIPKRHIRKIYESSKHSDVARSYLAEQENLPKDIVVELSKDSCVDVLISLTYKRSNLTNDIISNLLKYNGDDKEAIIREIYYNPHISEDIKNMIYIRTGVER